MSEIRYNILTDEWVIIAPDRLGRPDDWLHLRQTREDISTLPQHKEDCPFCPGNESQTPPEVYRKECSNEWIIRVVPNKYNALSPDIPYAHNSAVFHSSISGHGIHNVIIEHPKHNQTLATMPREHIVSILNTYQRQIKQAQANEHVQTTILFKNHGPHAGTSLEHPHSQLIALPVIPPHIAHRIERLQAYTKETGNCQICEMIERERNCSERVILETECFFICMPYAALSPYHLWIFPKIHQSQFTLATKSQIQDLAIAFGTVLEKIFHGLQDPDYNLIVHTIPSPYEEVPHFHWHISIVPRIVYPAGFEVGSGMFINCSIPEKSAQFLREFS